MKRKVLLLGDPALYEVSSAVTREELEELRPDIEDMFECLKDAGFGHGISAPQIGIKKRLICLDLDGVRRVIVNPTLELVGSEFSPADVLATVGLRGPVDYTVVQGRVAVKEGHLVTIDEAAVAEDARRCCRDYLSR